MQYVKMPIPVAVRCKAWVCGRLIAGFAGSDRLSASLSSASTRQICVQFDIGDVYENLSRNYKFG
jgi:hypothetical protein